MPMAELRAAVRSVRRAPLIPALVMLLAATGVGFALAMWSLVDALYLRPLPFPAPDRIVTIAEVHPHRGRMAVTAGNFLDWSASAASFSAVSGSQWIEVSLQAGGDVERVTGARVLPSFFDVWGLLPSRGRTLATEDFDPSRRVAVVSERVWRQRLQASPNAIGSSVRLDGASHIVIGVMPAAASAVGHVEVWVPWSMTPDERTERRYHLVSAIGRLRAGRSAAAASAELEARYATLARAHPDTTRDWHAVVRPLREDLLETPASAVPSMAAVVAVTFGIACLNVAALLAAWWSSRGHELVTRLALGATRRGLIRQLIAETVVIAAPGLAGGVLLAAASLHLLASLAAARGTFDFQPALDGRAMAGGAVLLAVFIAAAAVVPALRAVWSAAFLVADVRSTRRLSGRAPMAAQVALALVVTVIAGALVQNVRVLTSLARSDVRRQLAIEIVLPETRYTTEDLQREFFARLVAALRTRAEIARVAASSYLPPTQALGNMRFAIDGAGEPPDAQTASPAAVDAEAFRALGIGLLSGRLFDARDGAVAPAVCIISAAMARRYWGDADPLGRRLRIAGLERPITIVGIVADVHQPTSTDPRAETILYLPFVQVPWPFMTLMIEPAGGDGPALAAVRTELARIDAGIAPGEVTLLDDVRMEWLRAPRLHAIAVSVFGMASLVLTVAGIYARIAYSVSRRRREWAVRSALGATPARLRRTIVSEAAGVTAAGVALGLAALPLLAPLAAGLVYGADLLDWPRALMMAAGVIVAAAIAADAPSRRAVRSAWSPLLRAE
jgi:putative ABC transport system permease protein